MDVNKKLTRFDEDTWTPETLYEVWLTEYDKYVLMSKLSMEVMGIKIAREKCGISEHDAQAEPNKHLASIRKLAKQLDIELLENWEAKDNG